MSKNNLIRLLSGLLTVCLIVTNSSVAVTQVLPAPVSTGVSPSAIRRTTINFKKNPGAHVVIESDGQIVKFSSCLDGQECSPVGKTSGYTVDELSNRYKQLRKKLWFNRLLVIPAGTLCATLLGAAYGLYEVQPILDAAAHAVENVTNGAWDAAGGNPIVAIPFTVFGLFAGVGASVGLSILAYTLVFTFGAIGFTIGLPGTWLATKLLRPNFKKAANQIRNGLVIEEAEITTGQNYENYMKSLDFALENMDQVLAIPSPN